jgi:hypothetical protein
MLIGRDDFPSEDEQYIEYKKVADRIFPNRVIIRTFDIGGLLGDNYGGTVTNCYSTGDANASFASVGGLAGWNYGNITNCYATGNVNGSHFSLGGLVGANGIGKTNLIEAIYMLSVGKSYRTNSDDEIIKWNKNFFRIIGNIDSDEIEIFASVKPNKIKIAKIKISFG